MPSPYELDLTAAQINTALNNAHDSANPPASGSGKLVNSNQIHSFVTGQVDSVSNQVALKTGLVYSGATGTLDMTDTYQDLDLSSIVGSNRAMVHLEVWDGSVAKNVFFREKGSLIEPYLAVNTSGWGSSGLVVGTANQGGVVVCPTNASGVLEYRSWNAVNGVNYRVVAYEVMRTS